MSLARLALRLAAYEALNPFATMQTGPWTTIAGKNVWDSRIDLIQEDDKPNVAAELEGKPVLIVYTEEDSSTPYEGGKKLPDEQIVHLTIEAMIAAAGEVEVPLPDGTTAKVGTIDAPISDRQHEAMLDLLEAQVRRLFDPRNGLIAGTLYAKVALETRGIESFPQRADDRVTRLAARTIRFRVKIRQDTWPAPGLFPVPTGTSLFPEPLRSVAAGLSPGSSGAAVCQQVLASLTPADPLPPKITSIGIVTDVDRDPVNSAPSQVLGLVVTDPDAPQPPVPPTSPVTAS